MRFHLLIPLICFILDLLVQLVSFCLASILSFLLSPRSSKSLEGFFQCTSISLRQQKFFAPELIPLSLSLSFFSSLFFLCVLVVSLVFLLEGGRTSAKSFCLFVRGGSRSYFISNCRDLKMANWVGLLGPLNTKRDEFIRGKRESLNREDEK